MRLFENILLLLLLFSLAWVFLPPHRRSRLVLYLPFVAAAVMAAHLIFEGYRWQMIPAYLLALGLLGYNALLLQEGSAVKPQTTTRPPLVRLAVVLLGLFGFLLISQLPSLLPVFNLPEPDGPYAVGTTGLMLVDPERADALAADPTSPRQVPVQIWYPAEPDESQKPADYWLGQPQSIRILTRSLGLPFFLLDHLALVKTHSYLDAPLARAQEFYPVLVFSHGYRLGYLQQNTSIMETLASHGYVVASVAHPYQALVTPSVEGELVRFAAEFAPRFSNDPAFRDDSLVTWTEDLRFTLDALEDLNRGERLERFSGRLDLGRVGVFGMSFGGSAASRLCLEDARCKAGLTLDSPQYEPVLSSALPQPFLFFAAEDSDYVVRSVYEAVDSPAYLVTIGGTIHYDFTDLTLVSPLGSLFGFSGTINGEQMVRILNAYTLAFFNRHIKDLPAPLLNGISADYPEVRIESRAP